MPYKNRATKNWYERKNKARIRKYLIEYLGGNCAYCQKYEPEIKLEFDHINPEEKQFKIAKNINMNWEKLKIEIDKCQLLCNECHMEKTYGSLPF